MSYDKNKYAEMYRRPEWQKMRLRIMERDEFCCVECLNAEGTLNVHHAYYVIGRTPWDYPESALVTLCEPCHKYRHDNPEIRTMWEDIVGRISLGGGRRIIPVLDALEEFASAMCRAKEQGHSCVEALMELKKACSNTFPESVQKTKRKKK